MTAILVPVYPAQDSLESLYRHGRERGEVRRRERERERERMTMMLWQEMLSRYGIMYAGTNSSNMESISLPSLQGYLVTGLLHRLRYILEVVRPGPTEVTLALEILTRVSRHSLQAASEVSCVVPQSQVRSCVCPAASTGGPLSQTHGHSL